MLTVTCHDRFWSLGQGDTYLIDMKLRRYQNWRVLGYNVLQCRKPGMYSGTMEIPQTSCVLTGVEHILSMQIEAVSEPHQGDTVRAICSLAKPKSTTWLDEHKACLSSRELMPILLYEAVEECTLKRCTTLTELSAELMSSKDMPCICRSVLHQQDHVDAVRQIWHLSCDYMLFATTDQLLCILCLLTQQTDNPTSTQDNPTSTQSKLR